MEGVPKNIRQIGEREERIKIYVEDYVGTYLRKLQEDREEVGGAGLLIGTWPFISGAIEAKEVIKDGNRLVFDETVWDGVYGELSTYFSGQDLCGIFVCEGTCRRIRRQALFSAVRECFPDRKEVLLFVLTEEGEEILYRITKKQEERLQGYYCYFERNEAMQDYMMDNLRSRQVEKEKGIRQTIRYEEDHQAYGSDQADRADRAAIRQKEGSLGDPVESFRERMRKQQEEKAGKQKGKQLFQLCASMAAVVFVCGLILVQRERGTMQVQELLDRLKIDATQILQVSGRPVTEDNYESYVAGYSDPTDSGVVIEEIPGNVYPTEEPAQTLIDPTDNPSIEPSIQQPTESSAEAPADLPTESSAEEPAEAPTEPSTEPPVEPSVEVSTESSSDSSAEDTTQPVSGHVTYVVQAGDSLYSISRRFYGTEAMAVQIQQLNQLENADLIKEGQTLILP